MTGKILPSSIKTLENEKEKHSGNRTSLNFLFTSYEIIINMACFKEV